MKPLRLILLSFFIICSTIFAGEYADAFLEFGVSPRISALANATGAFDYNLTSFSINPAGIAYIRKPQIGAMYSSPFGLANYHYIGAAMPVSKSSSLVLSWIRYGVDDIPLRPDILRLVTDQEMRRDSILLLSQSQFKTFQDCEDAFFISYGKFLSKEVDLGWRYYKFWAEFPMGINIKIIHKKLYNVEAFGMGIDIGGRIRASGEDILDIKGLGKLSVGLAVQNLTKTTIYWNTKRQDVIKARPILSFGLEQPITPYHLLINAGAEKSFIYDDSFRYGAEFIFKDCVNFRAGYQKTGISVGLGLNFNWMNKRIAIDYAFQNHV
ncbi:MAG: hypothetical protein PHW79_11145, partial [Candidatus Marinimicrobia bacterium]|nr:hypothetical protein [Candidatus Neomarinimicrobiota bacterium]